MIQNTLLRQRIDARKCIVEDEDARVAQYRPCYRGALLLPTRERDPAFPHDGVIPGRKALDIRAQASNIGRAADLLGGSALHAECDVLPDRRAEQKRLLRNEAD